MSWSWHVDLEWSPGTTTTRIKCKLQNSHAVFQSVVPGVLFVQFKSCATLLSGCRNGVWVGIVVWCQLKVWMQDTAIKSASIIVAGGIEPKPLIPQHSCWMFGAWSRPFCFLYNTAGVTMFYPSGCRKVILYCVFYITLHYITLPKFPKFHNPLLYLVWLQIRANTSSLNFHVSVESHWLRYAYWPKKKNSFSENVFDVRKITTDTNKHIRFKCKRESSIKLNTCTALFQFFPYWTACVIRTQRVVEFQYGPYCFIKDTLWKWI